MTDSEIAEARLLLQVRKTCQPGTRITEEDALDFVRTWHNIMAAFADGTAPQGAVTVIDIDT